ncbi:MAG: DUF1365 domain-containing protein [Alphaproteobacteria bacterium]|nr:DUF1365 domain-containing protein [Alphaproteobacteria bacterium]
MTQSCLYIGQVMHRRLIPFGHRFAYRVFSLWLDLDEIPSLATRLRWFAHNRFNLFSFHDRDHGRRDGSALRPWIEGLLGARGVDLAGGRIALLCFPRVLGYVFNPLTIFFCWDGAGALRAIVYEVKNTFGEQHCYVLPVESHRRPFQPILQRCDKRFHVSPFIGMSATYRFRLVEPGEKLSILIRQGTPAGELLIVTHTARRAALDDAGLIEAFLSHPLVTLKVVCGIHWEALKLWLKGARYHAKPARPERELST